MDERGFFAANKGSRPFLDVELEAEARAQDVVAQIVTLLSGFDGGVQMLDGKRIFCPAIDIAFVRTHRIGADDHAFQHLVGVAFQHAAVHERAGIAFVSVADHIFLSLLEAAQSAHFKPVENPAPRPRKPEFWIVDDGWESFKACAGLHIAAFFAIHEGGSMMPQF